MGTFNWTIDTLNNSRRTWFSRRIYLYINSDTKAGDWLCGSPPSNLIVFVSRLLLV